jgi:ABC-type bacteriocin/lantibiotic exporter with double-glycine peptidase domain
MILHPYPTVTQRTRDDCGAAIVSSILRKHNIKHQYTRLCRELNVSNKSGTEEKDMVTFLNGKGFRAWMTYDMTIDSLVNFIDSEIPVILIIQAWSRSKREDKYESFANYGHYVLAIGHDDDRVIFMDSGLPFGSYGYLTKEELEKRWYYVSDDNRRLRVGIVVEPPQKNNLVHIR